MGSQVLAERAEQRWDRTRPAATGSDEDGHAVFLPDDFDLWPTGYQSDEDEALRRPLPIPVVLSSLRESMNDRATNEVEAELHYVIGTLDYIVSRLTCKESCATALRQRRSPGRCGDSAPHAGGAGDLSTGLFLNLHCGHNNQYAAEERETLMALIRRLRGDPV